MRAVWAEVDLNSILYNVREIKKFIGKNVGIIAVIKADAYGFGAEHIAITLKNEVNTFGVALLKEAIYLRDKGIDNEILVLSYTDELEYSSLVQREITQSIFTYGQGKALDEVAGKLNKKAKVHLKIDTGMHRLGFCIDSEFESVIEKLKDLKNIDITGIYSHIANGGEKDLTYTKEQIERFKNASGRTEKILEKKLIKHLANSATLIEFKDSHFDMVRPGILIYGSKPTNHINGRELEIKRVLTLKGRIIDIKKLPPGEPVSYGGTFITKRESKIAVIGGGYEDGIFRALSNKGYVYINGSKGNIVGTICMDHLMVDVTDIEDVKVRDEVVIYGEKITPDEVANIIGGITYEVFCAISPRVPRIYVRKTELKENYENI